MNLENNLGSKIDTERQREIELNTENIERLQALMGEYYDSLEMSDYSSYFHPDEMKNELDLLEKKKGMFDEKELIKKFKEHLSYLAITGRD